MSQPQMDSTHGTAYKSQMAQMACAHMFCGSMLYPPHMRACSAWQANVNPAEVHHSETMNTLNFASSILGKS